MKKTGKKVLTLLLAFVLVLCSGMLVTATEETTETTTATRSSGGSASLSVGVKAVEEKDARGYCKGYFRTDETVTFEITVNNYGRTDADYVYVEVKSSRHLDMEDSVVVVGPLQAGEKRTVTISGKYWSTPNSTGMSYVMMRTFVPIYETVFTWYAGLVGKLNRNAASAFVRFYDSEDGIDNDYGILVRTHYSNGAVTTTEMPVTETVTAAEEIQPTTEPVSETTTARTIADELE